jgi:hypothetical protein
MYHRRAREGRMLDLKRLRLLRELQLRVVAKD